MQALEDPWRQGLLGFAIVGGINVEEGAPPTVPSIDEVFPEIAVSLRAVGFYLVWDAVVADFQPLCTQAYPDAQPILLEALEKQVHHRPKVAVFTRRRGFHFRGELADEVGFSYVSGLWMLLTFDVPHDDSLASRILQDLHRAIGELKQPTRKPDAAFWITHIDDFSVSSVTDNPPAWVGFRFVRSVRRCHDHPDGAAIRPA